MRRWAASVRSAAVMRPQNTFNLDRVEVLRRPSWVLNGQGAVAGTVNAITKRYAGADAVGADRAPGRARC